jgi:DNA repair protein RadC
MEVEALDDEELLLRLIGPAARAKVRDRDLGTLLAVPADDLALAGLSATSASRIVLAAEIARRHQPPAQSPPGITRPRDVVARCQELRASSVERLAVLSLDSAGRLLDKQVVAVGSLAHVGIAPREVFGPAIVARARSIVLVHNHPSGNVRASPEDLAFTRGMAEAARLLGIDLVDHLIVGQRAYFSFWESGLISADQPAFWKAG